MENSNHAWWHPEQYKRKLPILEQRSRLTAALRAYFSAEQFHEVETPALQQSPGIEPHLMAFATDLENPFGLNPERLYLHTSPEFTMKKLLVAGFQNIFQLARCYRNRERSHTHHPEFTMLEWYRVGVSYEKIMNDCEELLRACMRVLPERKQFTWNNVSADPFAKWQRISVCEAFTHYTKIDLMSTIVDEQKRSAVLLGKEAEKIGIRISASDSWEDIFFRIFLEKIEKNLGVGAPTILYDYPISMAALSRPKKSDPRFAERFEVYVCGLELANAFSELTDAKVQSARFEADSKKKEDLYGFRYPIDEDFLAALEYGYPESAGIALGVDRLVMLATGASSIDDVLWAPVHSGHKI